MKMLTIGSDEWSRLTYREWLPIRDSILEDMRLDRLKKKMTDEEDNVNGGQATFLGTELKKFKVTSNQSSSIKALRRRKTITKLRKKKKKTIRMSNKTNAHSFKRRVRNMKQSSCTHKPKGHSCDLFNANRIELYQFLRSIVDDNSTPEHVLHWLKELKNRDRHLLGRSSNVCSG